MVTGNATTNRMIVTMAIPANLPIGNRAQGPAPEMPRHGPDYIPPDLASNLFRRIAVDITPIGSLRNLENSGFCLTQMDHPCPFHPQNGEWISPACAPGRPGIFGRRSEERRVGKECKSECARGE